MWNNLQMPDYRYTDKYIGMIVLQVSERIQTDRRTNTTKYTTSLLHLAMQSRQCWSTLMIIQYTLNKNHWMNKTIPLSRCCKRNSLSNEGMFMVRYPANDAVTQFIDNTMFYLHSKKFELHEKEKKLSRSIFYWMFQKKILRVYDPTLAANYMGFKISGCLSEMAV